MRDMNEIVKTFYIFHGDDALTRDEAVAKLRAGMGGDSNADLNTSEYEGESVIVPEVINAVSSYPFLADRRLVLVKGMLAHLTRKGAGAAGKQGVEQLLDALPTLPAYARLVFVERQPLSDKDKVVQLAASHPNGLVRAFLAPKDSTGWIQKRVQSHYQAQIDNRAASALAELVGNDLLRADSEIDKLVHYVDGARPITEADVAALTAYVAEANVFALGDALALGQGRRALELLHKLQQEKDNDAFSLMGMMIRQFRLLLLAKEHLTTGGAPGSIASALGVAPFVAQKLAEQSRPFTIAQLENILRALADYDLKMKTGRIDPDVALDLFTASVTR